MQTDVADPAGGRAPRDVVAIFHSSFHPTKGNMIDWALKVDDDVDLTNLEFSVLPSGLHLVPSDTIYFPHPPHHTGLAIYTRQPTSLPTYRGFKLRALAVILRNGVRGGGSIISFSQTSSSSTLPSRTAADSERQRGKRGLSTGGRPWRYARELKELMRGLVDGDSDVNDDVHDGEEAKGMEEVRRWFEARRATGAVTDGGIGGGLGEGADEDEDEDENEEDGWTGWEAELALPPLKHFRPLSQAPNDTTPATDTHTDTEPSADEAEADPTKLLPTLLHTLGPSLSLLWKHVLGRRRILMYTDPPVEDACLFCWAVGGLCRGVGGRGVLGQQEFEEADGERVPGLSEGGEMEILGLVTLSSLPFLLAKNAEDAKSSSNGGRRGWIACTTDAVFLEKPEVYDLLVDLRGVNALGAGGVGARVGGGGLGYGSAYGEGGAKSANVSGGVEGSRGKQRKQRPVMWMSRKDGKRWKLDRVRPGWYDVKLWTYLTQSLPSTTPCLPECTCPSSSSSSSSSSAARRAGAMSMLSGWTDIWKVYEDACLFCANVLLANANNGSNERGAGEIRLEGEDQLSVSGRKKGSSGSGGTASERGESASVRRRGRGGALGIVLPTLERTSSGPRFAAAPAGAKMTETEMDVEVERIDYVDDGDDFVPLPQGERERTIQRTLAILNALHAHSTLLLSRTDALLSAPAPLPPSQPPPSRAGSENQSQADVDAKVVLTPRDLLALDLGPFSSLDARLVEWLAEVYGAGRRVSVRRGWRDYVNLVFGCG